MKLITSRFTQPEVNKDCRNWSHACVACQRNKVQCHVSSPLLSLHPPNEGFQHVHIDIIRPLPSSQGYCYTLTMINRFTCWTEVIPIADIASEMVAQTFVSAWISRIGAPTYITTGVLSGTVRDQFTISESRSLELLHLTRK